MHKFIKIKPGTLVQYYWENCYDPKMFPMFGEYGLVLKESDRGGRAYEVLMGSKAFHISALCLKVVK